MESININNLFGKKFNNDTSIDIRKNFSVSNITTSNIIKNILNDDDIIEKIKLNKITEKKKLNDKYQETYNQCLVKINNAIDHDLTDIYFCVGEGCFGIKSYKSRECLNYIQNKLREKNFETLIYSENDIFISWKNLKNKINEKK